MNLHRVRHKPDWELVDADSRNLFQQVAHATRGIITPGNAITLTGLGLVLYGLSVLGESTFVGFLYIASGRFLDIFDGLAADSTGTKSQLGEKLDSVADKLAIFLVAIVYISFNIIPTVYVALILILQIVTSYSVLRITAKGKTVHTPKIGKRASFLLWVTVGLFSVAYLPEDEALYRVAITIAHVAFGLTLYMNVRATGYYVRKLRSN